MSLNTPRKYFSDRKKEATSIINSIIESKKFFKKCMKSGKIILRYLIMAYMNKPMYNNRNGNFRNGTVVLKRYNRIARTTMLIFNVRILLSFPKGFNVFRIFISRSY